MWHRLLGLRRLEAPASAPGARGRRIPVRPGRGRPAPAQSRGLGHAPRFTTFGVLLALLGSWVLPLAMFLTYARNDRGPLGWRRGGSLLLRYPLATFLALVIVPLGVVVAEGGHDPVHGLVGRLPVPRPRALSGLRVLCRTVQDRVFRKLHPALPPGRRDSTTSISGGSIRVTTSSARIPASLSTKTSIMQSPWTLELSDGEYPADAGQA